MGQLIGSKNWGKSDTRNEAVCQDLWAPYINRHMNTEGIENNDTLTLRIRERVVRGWDVNGCYGDSHCYGSDVMNGQG